ncbi:hypothetical protein KAS50_01230, partial [bacterium]|nr:hypothetical protein [bacterium]
FFSKKSKNYLKSVNTKIKYTNKSKFILMIPKNYKTKTKQYSITTILPPYQFKKKKSVHYHFQIEENKKRFEYDIYTAKAKIDKYTLTNDTVEQIIKNKLIDFLQNEVEEYKKIIIGDDDIEKFLNNRKMDILCKILDEKGIIKKEEIEEELKNRNITGPFSQ